MMSCLVYSLELVEGYRRTDQDWKPLRDEIVNELDEKPDSDTRSNYFSFQQLPSSAHHA